MTEFVDAHHHIWRQADLPWLVVDRKLWIGYREPVDGFRAAAPSLRPDRRDAIFGGTAMRVHRLTH